MPDTRLRSMNALRRLVSALRTTGADSQFGPLTSVAQRFALRCIGNHPGLTMSELARATLTSRGAVSEVVTKLVRQGLVNRTPDPDDQRRSCLRLTPEGAAVFSAIDETLPERLVRSLESLTPVMRENLAAALETWIAFAGLSQEAPVMFGEHSVVGETSTCVREIRLAKSGNPSRRRQAVER